MQAKNIMVTSLVTVSPETTVRKALKLMRESGHRILPVVDGDRKAVGELTTLGILLHVCPEYIRSGDLEDVAYAPDIGVLHQQYIRVIDRPVSEVMNKEMLIIHGHESILAVAAAIVSSACRHDYGFVVDDEGRLQGIISASDVLYRLSRLKKGV